MKTTAMMLALALTTVVSMSLNTMAYAKGGGGHGGGRSFHVSGGHGGGFRHHHHHRFYGSSVYVAPGCWEWKRGYKYWVC